MRSLKFIFTLVIIGCMAFTSCKKKVDVEQLSLIPNTAAMVMEIDGREILKKSGMDKPDDFQFLNIIKMAGGDTYTFVESLLKSSKDAGVSIDQILIYSTEIFSAQQYIIPSISAFFQILDKKAFEGWMKKFGLPEPKEINGIRYVAAPDLCMAWNDNLLNFSNNGSIENLASLFTPKEDGLLATNEDFKQFVSKKSDMRMWIHYGSSTFFHNLAEATIDIEDFKKITLHGYSNFKDGKVEGLMSIHPAEAITQIMKKFPVIKEKFDTQLMKDMPEQSFLAFNLALNVPEYFKIFRENAEAIINMLTSSTGSPFNDSYYKDELTSHYDEMNSFLDSPELKTIIDALGGDALFSIHGFNQGMITYPLASLNFTVNNEESFKNMLKLFPDGTYRISAEGYYSINIQKLIPVYFAYKNNKVIVSTDLNTTQEFIAETKKDKNFSHNPISKLMASKMVFNLNLDIESYPTNIKLFLQNHMGSQFNMVTSFMEIYENMYFSSDENFNIEFVLNFKNKNVNSLKQFFKSIDKIAWNQ